MVIKIGFWDFIRSLWTTEKYAFLQIDQNFKNIMEKLPKVSTIPYFLINKKSLRLCPVHALTKAQKTTYQVSIDFSKCIKCGICKSFYKSSGNKIVFNKGDLVESFKLKK